MEFCNPFRLRPRALIVYVDSPEQIYRLAFERRISRTPRNLLNCGILIVIDCKIITKQTTKNSTIISTLCPLCAEWHLDRPMAIHRSPCFVVRLIFLPHACITSFVDRQTVVTIFFSSSLGIAAATHYPIRRLCLTSSRTRCM